MTINVNNIDIYYEQTGSGPPLLLLHGNGESHKIFHKAMGLLGGKFTVYAIDSRGHGQSSPVKTLHYADMAEDAAAFIQALGLEKPMLYGFSDGGIVGLLLALSHPVLLSRLAVSGANLNPCGLNKRWRRWIKLSYILARGDKMRLMLHEPDISLEQLARLNLPVLVLAGEKDIIEQAHTRTIAGAIPGARLQILPGEGHASYVFNNTKLCDIVVPFFEEN